MNVRPGHMISRRNFLRTTAWVAVAAFWQSSVQRVNAAPQQIDTTTYDVGGVRYNVSFTMKPYNFRVMQGGRVHRFEVRSGDRGFVNDKANRNERAEIVTASFRSDQSKFRARSGSDYWLSYAFMVEKGPPIVSQFVICGQMHDIYDPRDVGQPPPLCFVLSPSSGSTVGLSLQTRSDPNPISLAQRRPSIRWIDQIPRGKYVRLVTRVRFDPFGKGELQLWLDGREVLKLSKIPIGYNNPEDQAYWQYGIYRQENANPLAVRYANMEQSPKSLKDRVRQPLPLPT